MEIQSLHTPGKKKLQGLEPSIYPLRPSFHLQCETATYKNRVKNQMTLINPNYDGDHANMLTA